MIEGATVTKHNFDSDVVELEAAAEEIRVYSKSESNSEAKWKVVGHHPLHLEHATPLF